jgi:IS5 family transposase
VDHVLEHTKASIRATVVHPVRMIKRQFGNVKANYRGLAKNGALVPTVFAPSHVWIS